MTPEKMTPKLKSDPLLLMYQALLGISFIAGDSWVWPNHKAKLQRIQQLADQALRTMNSEHTRKMQKALGITK